MSKFMLIDGDEVLFLPNFGAAVVTPQPGKIAGSGPKTLGGKKVCVDGDEKKVEVKGCTYITPVYSIPGTGTLKITALGGGQKAKKTQTGGKKILLAGSKFEAGFEVQSPAKQPPPGPGPPVPDATPKYSGKGKFLTNNTKVQGS